MRGKKHAKMISKNDLPPGLKSLIPCGLYWLFCLFMLPKLLSIRKSHM